MASIVSRMSHAGAPRRSRRRPVTVAGVIAVAFVAALSPPASASLFAPPAPPTGQLDFGTYVFAEPFNELELRRLRAAGGEVIRTTFLWSKVQRTRLPFYDWSEYDALVARAAAAGVSILPVLIGSPQFVAPRGAAPPTTPLGKALFARYARAAVERYGPGGEFWRENPFVPYEPIEAWEVWNEPNLASFWTEGDPDAQEYAALLKLIGGAIHEADPRAKVVFAGMPEPRGSRPIPADEFLADVYEVPGIEAAFDVVAAHPYAGSVGGVDRRLARLRAVMRRNGDEEKPLWITELGWSSTGIDHYLVKDLDSQARLTRDTIAMLRERAAEYKLGTVIFFRWQDPDVGCSKVGGCWYDNAGLFTSDERPKPAWKAFARGAGGRPLSGPLPADFFDDVTLLTLDAAG